MKLLPFVAVGLIASGLEQHQPSKLPTPPVFTDVQKRAMQRLTATAKKHSQAATPQVLAFFDAPQFREGLEKCCPSIARITSEELLGRFREEVRSAELAHSFPVNAGDVFAQDITVPLAEKYNWFLSEWQAPIASGAPDSNVTKMYSLAEVNYFGLKPFAHNNTPTWQEAGERLLYIAHNLRQIDTGSLPAFGSVSAIFSNDYVKDMVAIAPIDTGLYELSCNHSLPHPASSPPDMHFACADWDGSVGTYDYLDHVILPNFKLFTTHSNTTMLQEALSLFNRSAFAGEYNKLTSITNDNAGRYYEANILGNPRFPDGVKFLVGNFPELFGTKGMIQVQRLVNQYSWPLVWALGDPRIGKQGFSLPNVSFRGNQRLLDPSVAAAQTLNVTLSPTSNASFWQLFDEVARARQQKLPPTSAQWEEWWTRLTMDQAMLAPLTARACTAAHACIGSRAGTGDCVCRNVETKVEQVLV